MSVLQGLTLQVLLLHWVSSRGGDPSKARQRFWNLQVHWVCKGNVLSPRWRGSAANECYQDKPTSLWRLNSSLIKWLLNKSSGSRLIPTWRREGRTLLCMNLRLKIATYHFHILLAGWSKLKHYCEGALGSWFVFALTLLAKEMVYRYIQTNAANWVILLSAIVV